MKTLYSPRTINPANTFEALVQWFHDDLIIQQQAPGFLVGLSGTDSLVTFLAASKAFERAGKPHRVLGVHFAPSEDFLYDHPEAEAHLWFKDEMIPWLRNQVLGAQIVVDTSIDWRYDGLRWGSLLDTSVVASVWTAGQLSHHPIRRMLSPEEQYWVVGTRNLTEDMLLNYSNASTAASLQPLIHLWKSEILQLSEYLGAPQVVINKSCETDCICGRMRLPAQHIPEVDMLLMAHRKELAWQYVEEKIPLELQQQLTSYIHVQINKGKFKKNIPYSPDSLVIAFQNGSLNLSEFNHRQHLYIAWYYLKNLYFGEAVTRYAQYLKPTLEAAGQSHRFDLNLTRSYMHSLFDAMKAHPTDNFGELMEKCPFLLAKKQKTSA
jgi:NH3-dependent NAD+ synthetase